MTNWKTIHSDFTSELQKQWEINNFTYNQTQDWIKIGLTPNDCPFATYLRDVLKCEPEEALNFVSNLEELRTQYQEYLQSQNEESEENQLARAAALSLGIFNFSDNPLKGLSDEEAEQYLSTKRLSLKRYFVFNLGQEVNTDRITVSGKNDKIRSEPIGNVRSVKPLLSEHLTKLFNDGNEKKFIAFAGEHANHGSLEWMENRLDHKITNGKEVYIVFDKRKINANPSYIKPNITVINEDGEFEGPRIIILAMEAKPQVKVFQCKKNALKFLRDGDTSLFTKGLTADENELLEQMGVDSSKYEVAELKKMLEYANIAKRSADKLPTGKGKIKKIIFFSPPHFQDKDCAVVISEGKIPFPILGPFGVPTLTIINIYDVSLLVYEASWQHIRDNLYVRRPVRICLEQGDAEREADKLVRELMNKNDPYPACVIFDKVEHVFNTLAFNGNIEGVKGSKFISFSRAKNNPEGRFKPLDIVRVENIGYSHVGIYLGKDKKGKHKVAQMTRANNDAEITDWSELFSNSSREVSRYHPFIPYKQPKLIKEHIAKAIASSEYSGSYSLFSGAGNYKKGNCQHFVNRCVLGLNISNEATLFKKDSSLRNEIEKTNQHFNSLTVSNANRNFHQARIKEINECVIVYKPSWEWKKTVNLKPNSDCKLQ